MKKKLLALSLALVMAASFTACGDKTDDKDVTSDSVSTEEDSTSEENTYSDEDYIYNALDCVSLGQYEGVEVTVDNLMESDLVDLDAYILAQLPSSMQYVQDDETTVIEENSIVNVDYVGSKDGVPFQGGSAENVTIDVAANAQVGSQTGYIEGFTAGLAGHEVGEEIDCDVTFPEQYGNSDLAGQQVVFTFKINYIAKPFSLDMITDENVAEYFSSYTSVTEMKADMETKMMENIEAQQKSAVKSAVVNTVVANSTVNTVPEAVMKARALQYADSIAAFYGATSLKELCEVKEIDYDSYMSQIEMSISESFSQELVLEAIADKIDVQVDETEFNEFVQNMLTSSGYTEADKEAFFANYAIGPVSGEDYIKTLFKCNKAIDYCVEKAVVTYN